MLSLARSLSLPNGAHDRRRQRHPTQLMALTLGLGIAIAPAAASASFYTQTNLVSDLPGFAKFLDPNLVNPWGLASSSTSPIWVSDNHTGVSTVYNGSGQAFLVGTPPMPLVVTIPPPLGAAPPSAPDGVVFNTFISTDPTSFGGARFIWSTEDGTIATWKPSDGTTAELKVNNPIPPNLLSSPVYKGVAIGNNGSGNLIYAANFRLGRVDVFDNNFAPTTVPGGFNDSKIPAGFAPFNIQNIGGKLYVTYAKQDAAKHDDVAGPGNGFVDVFDTNGNLLQRLVVGVPGSPSSPLNSPWGMALAPSDFGQFSNDLLVGNFGNGEINAFDPSTGTFLGTLDNAAGNPIVIEGLWGLRFGNGARGGAPDQLFFAAGIPGPSGMVEDHGLFGFLAVPEPTSLAVLVSGLPLLGFVRRRRR